MDTTINGISVEIIEVIGDFLIIEEFLTKKIRVVGYYELDPVCENSKIEDKSNIYSLQEWKNVKKEKKS